MKHSKPKGLPPTAVEPYYRGRNNYLHFLGVLYYTYSKNEKWPPNPILIIKGPIVHAQHHLSHAGRLQTSRLDISERLVSPFGLAESRNPRFGGPKNLYGVVDFCRVSLGAAVLQVLQVGLQGAL